MIRRKVRKSTKQYITVAVCLIIILGGAFTFLLIHLTRQLDATYNTAMEEKVQYISLNSRKVFCAVRDIQPGEYVTAECLQEAQVLSSLEEGMFLTEEDFNKAALIEIPMGTPVTRVMVSQQSLRDNQREVEYQNIYIGQNITENDVVDIRISYPNGEDFLILTKKTVKNLNELTSCCLWLDEEELLLMSSALVDIYMFQGGKIYMTKYIAPTMQDALCTNYVPSKEVCGLIREDPNIVETASAYISEQMRMNLEERLTAEGMQGMDDLYGTVGVYSENGSVENTDFVIENTKSTDTENGNSESGNTENGNTASKNTDSGYVIGGDDIGY